MPPKFKFTKDEIITAAFETVRERGEDALTAREVAKKLGSSSSPIFTVFDDMGELKGEVRKKAKALFDDYMKVALDFTPAYKMRGMQWIKFAKNEPSLFRFLFMQDTGKDSNFDSSIEEIPFGKEDDIEIIMKDYNATAEQAETMFRQMWIYTYGMCVLSACGVCNFSNEEIAVGLGEAFRGAVHVILSNEENKAGVFPERRDEPKSIEIIKNHPDLQKNGFKED